MSDSPSPSELPGTPEALRATIDRGGVAAWREDIVLPTYEPDGPQPYPMYVQRRVYQGSSGRVYPLPVIEGIATEPVERSWAAIHLENRFVRVTILPELGGRIYAALDKTNGYDFFYRNSVIKPALVGLTGPWVSGGVELNWPQHHRPGSFLPVDTEIENADDGSVVVWCGDHDPLQRMKGMHGVRLHPERSIVQLDVRLHNRTSDEQTFLWWANVAVSVGPDYQAFFPPDVHYVADHARRAITEFPYPQEPYYGVDYTALESTAAGTGRIDLYSNIPVPTSYMVVGSKQDFFGGYDHRAQAGFVHWADHHVSPGKKLWTWGNAPFGHRWDAHLTDHDGPYVELMAGVFSSNQPDFSYLMPGETKTFSQYWYPIREIGTVQAANPDVALHLDTTGETATLGVYSTTDRNALTVRAVDGRDAWVIGEWTADIGPDHPFRAEIESPFGRDLAHLDIVVMEGSHELITLAEHATDPGSRPPAAVEPREPEDVESIDELNLVGIHLRQYRHPTRSPLPYWCEALRRDQGDIRANIAVAEHLYSTGAYPSAWTHIERAIQRLSSLNENAQDARAWYVAGLIARRQRRDSDAFDLFFKATWDGKWAHAAYFECARLAASGAIPGDPRALVSEAIRRDTDDLRSLALSACLSARSGDSSDAAVTAACAQAIDPLDQLSRAIVNRPLTANAQTLIDVALDLASFGERERALEILGRAAALAGTAAGNPAPMAHYHRAVIWERAGNAEAAAASRRLARQVDHLLCFPAGLDDHDALVSALCADDTDAVAHYLLGTLLMNVERTADALYHFRRAIDAGLREPQVFRNAGVAAYNTGAGDSLAWQYYSEALRLDGRSSRLLLESDQLASRLEMSPQDRLDRLESMRDLVLERDDLTVEYCELLISMARPREALEILLSRQFAPWEGGEGRVVAAWDRARSALGLERLDPPANLGEARSDFSAPAALRADGEVEHFATSLPEFALFSPR
jgi:tetratricopeptide (TPR) repeat protein